MLHIIIMVVSAGLSVLFRIAGALRLSIPLLYALIIPTLFHEWYYAHIQLAIGIWYGILVLVAVSWMISLVRWLRGWIN